MSFLLNFNNEYDNFIKFLSIFIMNILIIENSTTLSQIMQKSLESYGYKITLDNKDFDSKRLIGKSLFEIVIINSNLDKNFLTSEIIEYIKKRDGGIKILGVCSNGNWRDKVQFLNSGGDDIVSYPFPLQELLARIQSLIRRPSSYIDKNLYVNNFVLDTDSKCIYKENKEISVRKKEYDLFEYLVRNRDRAVSRCELLDHVWDYRQYVGSNTIDVHIRRLRDKLEDKSVIETIHGVGYMVSPKKTKSS